MLRDAVASGVEHFVSTSSKHTLAAGTAEKSADEGLPWNLGRVDSPDARSKREADALVLDALGGRLPADVHCPGMVIGPRDPKPTSTSLLMPMARSPVALLPSGGISVVDVGVAT